MMLTPWGPSAVPIGGAGLALPAGICSFTTALTRFAMLIPFFLSILIQHGLPGRPQGCAPTLHSRIGRPSVYGRGAPLRSPWHTRVRFSLSAGNPELLVFLA